MRIIISNKIRCKRCGDVIESKSHYDLEKCSCGLCCVDGGKDYVRRVIRTTEDGKYADYCEELSEWVEVPDPNDDDGTYMNKTHRLEAHSNLWVLLYPLADIY